MLTTEGADIFQISGRMGICPNLALCDFMIGQSTTPTALARGQLRF